MKQNGTGCCVTLLYGMEQLVNITLGRLWLDGNSLFGAILSVTVWNACVYQIDIRHLAGYIVWYVDYFLTDLLSHACMHVSTNFQCSWLALSLVMITNCCVHSFLVYHELYAYILYSEGQQLWLSIT